MADYDIDIEIDADDASITFVKSSGKEYTYPVEELEGKGIIEKLLGSDVQITVYSQGRTMTVEEYEEMVRDNK